MLKRNAEKVKNLSGTEIWLFIVARLLIGFGAGAILAKYYPQLILPAAIPILVVGVVLFAVAAKGLGRKNSD